MWYNGISAPAGVGQPIQANIVAPVFTGTSNPPTVSDFPGTTPGRLVSEKELSAGTPQIDLKGDGTWRLGKMYGSAAGDINLDALATINQSYMPKRILTGTINITVAVGDAQNSGPVNFPAGFFTTTPATIVACYGTTVWFATTLNRDATGFDVSVRQFENVAVTGSAVNIPVSWIAIQE
jgi:hypothetical protein